MSKLMTGSLCYTDLLAALKASHPAGNKAANGKIYVNIRVWINDEEDRFGNIAGIQLAIPKDSGADKVYIGNLKEADFKAPEPLQASDIDDDSDNLPF